MTSRRDHSSSIRRRAKVVLSSAVLILIGGFMVLPVAPGQEAETERLPGEQQSAPKDLVPAQQGRADTASHRTRGNKGLSFTLSAGTTLTVRRMTSRPAGLARRDTQPAPLRC